ncbi:MAG: hypothetical protein CTY30_03915 [Methylocystis sp.]|nr:MAG: hypothetical protein CTY30_03915 [Methylocystis sp.]
MRWRIGLPESVVLASEAKQSTTRVAVLDCFVASLLAMTAELALSANLRISAPRSATRGAFCRER